MEQLVHKNSDLISKFAYFYENQHKEGFKDELVVCLLDAVRYVKDNWAHQYSFGAHGRKLFHSSTFYIRKPMAANFFTALHSTSGKGFDIVSAKQLMGSFQEGHAILECGTCLVTKPCICYDNASVFAQLAEILQVLGGQSREHAFSVSIDDATKVPPVKQLAPTYSSVIVGCYPQHFVAVDDTTTPQQARAMLSDPSILKPPQEVKSCCAHFSTRTKRNLPNFHCLWPASDY